MYVSTTYVNFTTILGANFFSWVLSGLPVKILLHSILLHLNNNRGSSLYDTHILLTAIQLLLCRTKFFVNVKFLIFSPRGNNVINQYFRVFTWKQKLMSMDLCGIIVVVSRVYHLSSISSYRLELTKSNQQISYINLYIC